MGESSTFTLTNLIRPFELESQVFDDRAQPLAWPAPSGVEIDQDRDRTRDDLRLEIGLAHLADVLGGEVHRWGRAVAHRHGDDDSHHGAEHGALLGKRPGSVESVGAEPTHRATNESAHYRAGYNCHDHHVQPFHRIEPAAGQKLRSSIGLASTPLPWSGDSGSRLAWPERDFSGLAKRGRPGTPEPQTMEEFVCQRCGNCCRIDGQVRLTDADISRLAAFLGLSERDFIERYTRLARDRRGLTLRDSPDGACILLGPSGCLAHPAKPMQCREFPTRWTNPDWRSWCAGRPRATPMTERNSEVPVVAGSPDQLRSSRWG